MHTAKKTPRAPGNLPFDLAGYLESDADIALFLEEILHDGDPRAVPVALRTGAAAVGGNATLAAKTGLNRENLYRTLSSRGNPRLDTLCAILAAFGLRLAVQPIPNPRRGARKRAKPPARPTPAPNPRDSRRS
jgi:probable addiction module antidote protein